MAAEVDERTIRAAVESRRGHLVVRVGWITPSGRRRSVPMYETTVRNDYLNEVRSLQGTSDAELRARATNLLLRWEEQEIRKRVTAAKADARERAQEEAEQATASLKEDLDALRTLLPTALGEDNRWNWEERYDRSEAPGFQFVTPRPEPPVPPAPPVLPRPSFWEWLLPPVRRGRLAKEAEILERDRGRRQRLQEEFQGASREWEGAERSAREAHDASRREFLEKRDRQNSEVKSFRERFESGDPGAIEEYVRDVLEGSKYPDCFPRDYTVSLDRASGFLLVDVLLPPARAVPAVSEYRHVSRENEFRPVPMRKGEHRELYESALKQATLRTLHETFQSLYTGHVQAVSVRAWVSDVDLATGRTETRRLHAAYSTRQEFARLNLARVDLDACLAGLKEEPTWRIPDRPAPVALNVALARLPEAAGAEEPEEEAPRIAPGSVLAPRVTRTGIEIRSGFGVPERLEPAPAVGEEQCWVPPGRTVQLAGRDIEGGGLYIGEGLRGLGFRWTVEPALINPRLAVDLRDPDRAGATMPYWPSYSEISPRARGAYVEWLASGRTDPTAALGFVFLCFYGIERRVLGDRELAAARKEETAALLSEVRRLRGIYGGHGSFGRYSGQFLEFIEGSGGEAKPYEQPPPRGGPAYALPSLVKRAVGALLAEGKPIPAPWALAWLEHHPEARLRSPARRCPEEFRQLFELRYKERYGEGMRVSAKPGRWRMTYQPASASFGRILESTVEGVPDIERLSKPVRELSALAEKCADELDAFSRFVNRNPGAGRTLAAVSLLPEGMLSPRGTAEGSSLFEWVDGALGGKDSALVEAGELLSRWPGAGEKLTKGEAVSLAQVLERENLGLEPDVRFGGPPPTRGERVVLFRLTPPALKAPTQGYLAGTLLLRLATVVAAADGTVQPEEIEHLEAHLEKSMRLTAAEQLRLQAHLRWLAAAPPGMSGVRKRLAEVPQAQRDIVANLLVAIAGADGRFEPSEVKVLTQLFKALGLDEQQVYSRAHSLASRPAGLDVGPVPVIVPGAPSVGFSIPPPSPVETPATLGRVVLDPRVVEAKLRETAAVAALLGGIFSDEEAGESERTPRAEKVMEQGILVEGLDYSHSVLLRKVGERPRWVRAELEVVVASVGLMPEGALDVLNEAALDRCGEPLLEGDDPLGVNGTVLEEFLR